MAPNDTCDEETLVHLLSTERIHVRDTEEFHVPGGILSR